MERVIGGGGPSRSGTEPRRLFAPSREAAAAAGRGSGPAGAGPELSFLKGRGSTLPGDRRGAQYFVGRRIAFLDAVLVATRARRGAAVMIPHDFHLSDQQI